MGVVGDVHGLVFDVPDSVANSLRHVRDGHPSITYEYLSLLVVWGSSHRGNLRGVQRT